MPLDKQHLIQELLQLLPETRLVYLFGSQADGTATEQSDIDIAVLLPQKLDPITRFDIQESLASKLDRDVDLVDLLFASTVMQFQVTTKGECLYGTANERLKFEVQVMSMYQHLNEERADILRQYQS